MSRTEIIDYLKCIRQQATVSCPANDCQDGKIFIVNGFLKTEERPCPTCYGVTEILEPWVKGLFLKTDTSKRCHHSRDPRSNSQQVIECSGKDSCHCLCADCATVRRLYTPAFSNIVRNSLIAIRDYWRENPPNKANQNEHLAVPDLESVGNSLGFVAGVGGDLDVFMLTVIHKRFNCVVLHGEIPTALTDLAPQNTGELKKE